jgi:ceramide glucosyltransferase
VLKPLKGCDAHTEACLKSWFSQTYEGPVQLLFGVASPDDPVCGLVRDLIAAHPGTNAELVICSRALGPNAKVSTLVQLEPLAAHDLIVISDADIRAPADLFVSLLAPLDDPRVGLVNCFYKLANPATGAMRWEAVAINADFWTQVLQAQSLVPLDFALGAVMATTRLHLKKIGGLEALLSFLADDFQLGHKIAACGGLITLCSVAVECWSDPMGWTAVWKHQLRWARTIRACRPLPFFLSSLSNATVWPLMWLAGDPSVLSAAGAVVIWLVRIATAAANQKQLTGKRVLWSQFWLVPLKDLVGIVIWALAFVGNRIEWRGLEYRLLRDGRLEPL